MSSEKPKKFERFARFRASNKPYFMAVVAAVIVFMLVAPMTEKGNSMDPTVKKGDVVILQKKSYSENRGLPKYDDVLVFKVDFYEGEIRGEHRLGRVTGLPGDTIEINEGDVFRNGKKIKSEPFTKGETTGTVEPIEVGTNEVFVLCDNRETAIDSRNEDVGTLELKAVRGKAMLILFPFANFGSIK